MLRQHVPQALASEKGFRWRGGDISRLEGLTDAVFALSLTLLIVSLEVPTSFGDLQAAFLDLPAFGLCFTILIMFWWYHFQYHRRYGFEDFPAMVRVLPDIESAEVPVFLAYPEELRQSRRIAAFRDFVTEEIITQRKRRKAEALKQG